MADCVHHFELDSVEPQTGTSRLAKLHCTKCNVATEIITRKTDDQIRAEVDQANADAAAHA